MWAAHHLGGKQEEVNMNKFLIGGALAIAGLAAGAASAATLDDVKARGKLNCGVTTGVAGFASPDAVQTILPPTLRTLVKLTSARICLCKSQPAAVMAGVMSLVQISRSERISC